MLDGISVSHELHITMPLSIVVSLLQRNLLEVQRSLLGVQLSHSLAQIPFEKWSSTTPCAHYLDSELLD